MCVHDPNALPPDVLVQPDHSQQATKGGPKAKEVP